MDIKEDVTKEQLEECKKVVQAFFKQEKAFTSTLESDGKRLFSEGNCMAEWLDEPYTYEIINNNTKYGPHTAYFIINATQYSKLSPIHFSMLFKYMPEDKKYYGYLSVTKQPIGIQKLWKEKM